ncbi:probable glycosyltransferase At3g07620 [Cornus florida]|uniref:probable glycosyltransferase At3g07620 n=1 Tax=Cornus florida TaxID=4283 RepID=UPI0028971CE7|nr:probable glycosyltransferase At3g07620 [Cornus florida]XP_059642904.1 probable glycosyltransferase At3g07620 [Cornus florida]
MNKLLRVILVFLMFRLDWRKFFFAGAVITLVVVVIQIHSLPNLLTVWMLSPAATFSSYEPLNSTMHLGENPSSGMVQQFEPILVSLSIAKNKSAEVKQDDEKNDVPRAVVTPLGPPPPSRTLPTRLLKDIRSLNPEEALVYAKKEILNASNVADDPDLYAPLFRNVSAFKRSYELMELILKVYIYKDGRRPIFHFPYLRGIYSSEGWFMKFMKESEQFVTTDPEKAHLFYLPYSVRQMKRVLYVPEARNIKPLAIFLRDYVNMLATKYPFWNRTHGSDHFLVACHDWGSYTVTEHKELSTNTIKVLCNADVSEKIFVAGKDVSLAQTTIRHPRRPLHGLGGRRVSQRPILAFFAGKMHGRVRPKLLKYWRGKDKDMWISGPLPSKVPRKMSYAQQMKSSKYCICPMGYEVNSPRIVEAIYFECVPVIIADNFVPPLNEVLDWDALSVTVAEQDIPKLKEILLAIPMKRYLTMKNNVKMVQKHFLWNPSPIRYDLFHMVLHSIWYSRLSQIEVPQSS